MSISGLFSIAKTALFTSRQAIETTAHNVANAATPGYSRQRVILENIPTGAIIGMGASGKGVRIDGIERMYDTFINLQLRAEKSGLSYWDAYSKGFQKIEDIFNEADAVGISSAITEFFGAWQGVSQHPEEHAQRMLLIGKAEHLCMRINRAYGSLDNIRTELFRGSQNLAAEINIITAGIAALNEKIAMSPGALDLMDHRDGLLKELNQKVRVTAFRDDFGRYSVLAGGTPLVEGAMAYEMKVTIDGERNIQFHIALPHEERDITNGIIDGRAKAIIDLVNTEIPSLMNKLNVFAVNLTDKVNFHHRQGYGLDSSTGNNFFGSLATIDDPLYGGTVTSVSIIDAHAFSHDQFEIHFTATVPEDYADYEIRNLTTGESITLQPGDFHLGDGYRTLEFSGIKVRIDNEMTAQETFIVQINSDAARTMALEITDPAMVAAAQDPQMIPGDNRNATEIADLINQQIIAGSGALDFYRAIVSDVGVEALSADRELRFQNTVVEALERRREEISGVSLDEEAANLIKHQMSFEAAAKMVRIADELLMTLMNMAGR